MQKKGLFGAKPAQIKAPEWDRSKVEMILKEIHKQLWHLNGKMSREKLSAHGRDPVGLALK